MGLCGILRHLWCSGLLLVPTIKTHYNTSTPHTLNMHMKWMLVVYFSVAGSWHTAAELEMREWQTRMFPDAESCIQAQHRFTDLHPEIDRMRASCELK